MSESEIAGLSAEDRTPNVYEGGFKTWECAVDLAGHLARDEELEEELGKESWRVVEVLNTLPLLL